MDVLLFSATALVALTRTWQSWKVAVSSSSSASADDDECICLVTADNQILPDISGGSRREMRRHNLWHRATYILVKHQPASLEHFVDEEEFVLVQRRSVHKDYCPGKYDPTPGGVVKAGETYYENAVREIAEEMGICVDENNPLARLFTFSYQDQVVKVWGDFYECTFRGALHDLILQKEEVESCHRMSLVELANRLDSQPDQFMPDSRYAMRLYFQRRSDMHINRRLLKGYSSSDLDAYNLRPRLRVIFFDCDDCLYFDNWKTARRLTQKIDDWCVQHGLRPGQAYQLYKEYGTALKGLLAEGYLSYEGIDSFLHEVHDIPLELQTDERLRSILVAMDPSIPRYIFTASVREHAERCLRQIGIQDLFVDIIDCKACDLETKHSPHSFRRAMAFAGVENPEQCLLLDDNVKNIQAAYHVGWRTALVGRIGRDCGTLQECEYAEVALDNIHQISLVLPELFLSESIPHQYK